VDNRVAIAGALGHWRKKCFVCGTTHYQRNTVERCAQRFSADTVIGQWSFRTPGVNGYVGKVNEYELARKGMLKRWDSLKESGGYTHFQFPVEIFAQAETSVEASQLMAPELRKYVDACLTKQEEIAKSASSFTEDLVKAAELSPAERGAFTLVYDPGDNDLEIDGCAVDVDAALAYYTARMKGEYRVFGDLLALERGRWSWGLAYLDMEKDEAVFRSETYKEPAFYVGIKIMEGEVKIDVIDVKKIKKLSRAKAKSFLDHCSFQSKGLPKSIPKEKS
jgi:hypothetical protein